MSLIKKMNEQVLTKKYKLQSVKRVYIHKTNATKCLYRMSKYPIMNFLLSSVAPTTKKGDRPSLVNHLKY